MADKSHQTVTGNVDTGRYPKAAEATEVDLSNRSTTDPHVAFTNHELEPEDKGCESQAQIHHDAKEPKGTRIPTEEGEQCTEADESSSQPSPCSFVTAWRSVVKEKLKTNRQVLTRCVRVVLVLLYLAYSGYALYRQWGTESATRLWLVLAIVLWLCGGGHVFRLIVNRLGQVHVNLDTSGRLRKVTRWFLYLAAVAGAVVYLAVEVAPHHPNNLMSLAGIAVLLLVSLLLSSHPEKVNWHTVFWGLSLQFYLALFILRTQAGGELFEWMGHRLEEFVVYSDEGSKFLFGEAYIMHPFAFKTLPVIIFMNSVIAAGYYFGAVQAIIASFGRFLAWCLDTTPIESVTAAANIFLGTTDAPLFIKPFLDHVTESELFAIVAGGLASVSAGFTAVIIDIGIPANHVLAASVMSAPASLAIAKVMCPAEPGMTGISAQDVYRIGSSGLSKNLLEEVSKAAVVGVTIVVTVGANLFMFVALLAFADRTMEWFGDQAGVDDLTLSRVLAYPCYPLMYLCGVDTPDLLTMGRMVGLRTLTSTLLAYREAAAVIANTHTFNNYTTLTNGTWHHDGFDVILDDWNQTLVGGVFTDRSIVMSTYMLCGFSNLASCGMCIGSLSVLAPSRLQVVIKNVIWACVAASIACFLTGCFSGLLYN